MRKNTILLLAILTIMLVALTACGNEAARKDNEYSEEMKSKISDQVGYPDLANFFEYSQLKEIYELRDNPKLICYWYTKSEYTGKWIYEGKCIGYGIPYSASITSPDQVYYNSRGAVVAQAEPNGIYTNGLSTSATWILAADEEGNISPEYVEHAIRVSQSKIPAEKCEEWSLPKDY